MKKLTLNTDLLNSPDQNTPHHSGIGRSPSTHKPQQSEQYEDIQYQYEADDRQADAQNIGSPYDSKYKFDYSQKVQQYLDRMKIGAQSSADSPRDSSKEDEEVQKIIDQVLNSRRRKSRLSNYSEPKQEVVLKGFQSVPNIDLVNERLKRENEHLAAQIKKLAKKLTSSKFNPSKNSSLSGATPTNRSTLLQIKEKQLQNLKKRLEKAEQSKTRMQIELSKLQMSRKSAKSKRDSSISPKRQQKEPKNLTTRPPNTGLNPSSNSSPLGNRKDYYSPIMEFQEYSLKDEKTISLSNNNLHKTSQFGIVLQEVEQVRPKQSRSSQTESIWVDRKNEENGLDEQILRLEAIINKNNMTISNYENSLLKILI